MLKKNTLKAISLVEVLVYLALFGLIFATISQFVISIRDSNLVAEERADLEKTSIYLINHLNSSFALANNVSSDATTVYETDNGRLRLLTSSSYLEYYLENNMLYFNNNGTINNITSPDFTITKFYLEKILNNDGELKGIRCNLVLNAVKDSSVFKSIQTSFVLK